ncbi:MAG TPA: ABC transporter substrate-binding protein [Anaeromyxobacteraceae bacterium]|nr:ABC transporter substrate-binding protein [Anaeromyxobacteraceae bacterium]
MKLEARKLVAAALACAVTLSLPAHAAAQAGKYSDGVVKLGVLTDMTGYYSDLSGAGSVLAAKMAIADFQAKHKPAFKIALTSADHQLKADVAGNTARKWIDEQHVDTVVDLVSSSTALAVMPVVNEKKRIALLSGPGTTAITGAQCNPYTIHYTYNNWALANGTGREVVNDGGKTWFFITADYAFGKSLEDDTSAVVKAAGGKVLGSVRFPSPGTTDFSSYILQAQGSGAQVVGLANAGADTVNCIKAAHEYGLNQTLAGLLIFISDIHALGLPVAKGLYATTAFYWDMNDATRAWSKRFQSDPDNRKKLMPTMVQAGIYSAVTHYLEAVAAVKTDDADTVRKKMGEMPVNDFFAKNGRIGPDGLHRHDMYLVQVKTPAESKYPWDYYKIVKTIPADKAFPTVEQQKCPNPVK